MSRPRDLSLVELRDAIRRRDLSARDAVEDALAAIEAEDDHLHAFLAVFADRARAQAEAVDAGRHTGPLAGIPIAIKDNICLDHGPTTCASRMLAGYHSPYAATAAARLADAGAILIG
ncbi:MAG: Asp-tRNA(Asn)/Glu-tRNA(Gln) amidotransferase GatCAB subunit A, partial [Phycisphaerales bacterium]|nr:Asp-tRNA(Asn)/Glu-tRNA(Gln) amidotransferase GatCAB subunit A [Phycisphaerales bacterium]